MFGKRNATGFNQPDAAPPRRRARRRRRLPGARARAGQGPAARP